MARVTRLVIGEVNFTETACGFCFTASVCEPTEEIDDSHIRVRRLLALFPGTTVETVLSKPAPKEPEKEKKADAPAPKPEAPKAKTQEPILVSGNSAPPKEAEAPKKPDEPKKKTEDAPGPVPGQKTDHLPEESPGEPAKPSTVGKDDAEVKAKLKAAADEDHAAKADTEATKDKVTEAAPVKASDETGELEAVGEVVPAEGQDDAADAGAEGPGGE